jgi:DNA-directed RNA polymerase specialized sigma24 family protein
VDLPPFQALLDAHGRDVLRFLTATVGREAAEDCYQETWLSALRAYPRLRDPSNLRGWVLKIAHRKALDHHRSRVRAPVAVAEIEFGRVDPPPDDDDGVWGRVAALPVKQRAAVALRFIADAGYPEISAAMGTSEEAARRNVHEGLKRLRKELEA